MPHVNATEDASANIDVKVDEVTYFCRNFF